MIILELIIQGYRQTQHIPVQCLVYVEYTLERSPVHQRIHTIHTHMVTPRGNQSFQPVSNQPKNVHIGTFLGCGRKRDSGETGT